MASNPNDENTSFVLRTPDISEFSPSTKAEAADQRHDRLANFAKWAGYISLVAAGVILLQAAGVLPTGNP